MTMVRSGESGLTLVEMLAVIAIVGVMAGAVTLAAARGGGAEVETEARRLASRLQLAADEAMVTDRAIAFSADRAGYRFVAWDAARGRWQADPIAALGDRHDLSRGVTLASDLGARPLAIGADGGATMRARLDGGRAAWTVTFDGVGATARPDR